MAARLVLNELVTTHGEAGTKFSVCEVFLDAPASVASSGVAAWHFYIDGTTVTVDAGEVNDAEVTITADYQTTLPVARLVYTEEVLAELAKQPVPVKPATIKGDMSKAPPYLIELHNRLAVMTA